jgi:hypothetical protein
MKSFYWGYFCLVVVALPSLAVAQDGSSSANDDHQVIQQLLQKVHQLETRLQEVEGREHTTPPPATTSVVPMTTPVLTEAREEGPRMLHASEQPLHIRGYADVGFFATPGADNTPGSHSTFALGQFNLFMTSRISPRAGVLAELVVEPDPSNGVGVDLERLLFNYSVSDSLNFSLGRYHSSIGYYNTAFHHSAWMQTTVDRPFLFDFEDDGGILPIHNVGLSVTGALPSRRLGLHYVVEVGNGRTSRSRLDEAVQNRIDENNRKSVNIGFFVQPERWQGLQAGVSYYVDRLTPDPGTLFQNPASPFPLSVAAEPRIDERILAAHLVYQTGHFEFLNEVLMIGHDLNGYRNFHTPGFYSQISRRWGQARPYFRYQYVNANPYEPVFGDVGLRQGPTAGLRFDISESSAFKAEYDRIMLRGYNATNAMATQVSFAF